VITTFEVSSQMYEKWGKFRINFATMT